MKLFALTVLCVIRLGFSAAWYDALWPYRIQITNSGPVSGENLTNYPLLVKLSGDSVRGLTNARTDGYDICFAGESGSVLLSHELEYFTNRSGLTELIAWVKMPVLTQSTTNLLYMYYGNAASADMQNKNAVWDINYAMVHHLHQSNTATMSDSTANGLNGTTNAVVGQGAPGIVGNGVFLTGEAGSRIHFGTSPLLRQTTNLTVQVWFNASALKAGHVLMSYGSGTRGWFLQAAHATGPGSFFLYARAAGVDIYKDIQITMPNPMTNIWWMYTKTYDGQVYNHYLNGTLCYANTNETNMAYDGLTQGFLLGSRQELDGTFHFHGHADELRYSTNTRSAAWIKADYLYAASNTQYILPGNLHSRNPAAVAEASGIFAVSVPITISNTSTGGTSMSGTVSQITNSLFLFGDGSAWTNRTTGTNTNALASVAKTFKSSGVYTNWLVVTDNGAAPGSSSNMFITSITAYIPATLDFYFHSEPQIDKYFAMTLQFRTTYGSISSWKLDFGNGDVYKGTMHMDNHPTSYRYPKSGTYTVTFSIIDQYDNTASVCKNVTVSDYNASSLNKIPKRIYAIDPCSPLYLKYTLSAEGTKVHMRIINLNGMEVKNLGLREGFPGDELLFTWNWKMWNGADTFAGPHLIRCDEYSETGHIKKTLEIIVLTE